MRRQKSQKHGNSETHSTTCCQIIYEDSAAALPTTEALWLLSTLWTHVSMLSLVHSLDFSFCDIFEPFSGFPVPPSFVYSVSYWYFSISGPLSRSLVPCHLGSSSEIKDILSFSLVLTPSCTQTISVNVILLKFLSESHWSLWTKAILTNVFFRRSSPPSVSSEVGKAYSFQILAELSLSLNNSPEHCFQISSTLHKEFQFYHLLHL